MEKNKELLFLEPVFKEMIWGGDRLKKEFGYDIPGDHTGECWAVSAHKNGDCVVRDGIYKGKHLSWLWENKRELFGKAQGEVFPLLVKIIDAKEDLSIQVHPDDAYAMKNENGSLGKTECWYVLDCDPGTTIVVGHNAADKEELRAMIKEKRWKDLIRERPIKKGDFFQITPGTVHAIKGGTLILETQQSSDITYRLYDYDRLQNGKPRELHLEKSMDVIRCPYQEEGAERTRTVNQDFEKELLVSCQYYQVERLHVLRQYQGMQGDLFLIASVLQGEGKVDETSVKKGDHFIIPAGYGNFVMTGDMELMLSHV